jgi:hypothetical protein
MPLSSFCVAELGTSFDGGWRGLASCGRIFFKIPLQLTTRGARKEGGTGVPPVKEAGVERSPMSHLALRLHGRDAHAPLFFLRSGTRNEFRRRLAWPRELQSKFFQNSATGEWWGGLIGFPGESGCLKLAAGLAVELRIPAPRRILTTRLFDTLSPLADSYPKKERCFRNSALYDLAGL